jgi:hypothetical protein
LDEVDWELERRGLAFARYADDCNVYVKSKRAAERAMKTMEKIMGKLKLKINREKSAAGTVLKRMEELLPTRGYSECVFGSGFMGSQEAQDVAAQTVEAGYDMLSGVGSQRLVLEGRCVDRCRLP